MHAIARLFVLSTLLACGASPSAVERDDTSAASPEPTPCDEAYEGPRRSAFEVHGRGVRAGEVRHFRPGEVFSRARDEFNTVEIMLKAIDGHRLDIASRWRLSDGSDPADFRPDVDGEQGADGAFSVVHRGNAMDYPGTEPDTVITRTMVGRYRVTPAGRQCFRVELTADILEYDGE